MKTVLALLLIATLSASGQDWLTGNEPAWVKNPQSKSLWLVSYVCYEKGEADSIGCAIVEAATAKAARARYLMENVGEVCCVTNVEKAK